MLVSVLIPAYNAQNTIVETLESVFNQNIQVEIVIVNDGSTDQTLNILEAYKDKIILINSVNKGVSHARNLAYQHATGTYIQYLDADDLLAPGKLSKQVEDLVSNDADIAYGNFQRFKEEDKVKTYTELVTPKIVGDTQIATFTNFWCPPAALLYSRKITEKLRWNEKLPVIQDARYLLDAALNNGKFIKSSGLMAYYREGQANSLSKRSELNFYKDVFNNALELKKIWISSSHSNKHELTLSQKNALIEVLNNCVYQFRTLDSLLHQDAIDTILEINPNYKHQGNLVLRILSQFFGFKFTEKIARKITLATT